MAQTVSRYTTKPLQLSTLTRPSKCEASLRNNTIHESIKTGFRTSLLIFSIEATKTLVYQESDKKRYINHLLDSPNPKMHNQSLNPFTNPSDENASSHPDISNPYLPRQFARAEFTQCPIIEHPVGATLLTISILFYANTALRFLDAVVQIASKKARQFGLFLGNVARNVELR